LHTRFRGVRGWRFFKHLFAKKRVKAPQSPIFVKFTNL
jgi:hypothetical protein